MMPCRHLESIYARVLNDVGRHVSSALLYQWTNSDSKSSCLRFRKHQAALGPMA